MTKKVMFAKNEKVKVVVCNEIKTGVLRDIYELSEPMAIVELEDEVVKVPVINLIKINDTVVENQEEVTEEAYKEPVEKESITITPEEFRERASKAVARLVDKMDNPFMIMLGAVVCAELHDEFFLEDEK